MFDVKVLAAMRAFRAFFIENSWLGLALSAANFLGVSVMVGSLLDCIDASSFSRAAFANPFLKTTMATELWLAVKILSGSGKPVVPACRA